MLLFVIRGLFFLMMAAVVALYSVKVYENPDERYRIIIALVAGLSLTGLIIAIDVFVKQKKLQAFSGVFLGLIVGMLVTYALSFFVDYAGIVFDLNEDVEKTSHLLEGIKVFIGVVSVFTCISLVLQTRDDFKFIIPYVEFSKQFRGNRPMLLDSSAIIDGRILEVVDTNIIQGLVIIPKFIINELQTISDSKDKLKRARGRRGLDIVAKLQNKSLMELIIEDKDAEGATVDQKLIALAQELHARVITTDFNLQKVAEVRGVDVINMNNLANAMRPVVLPGEVMGVQIIKPGESAGQGVGYLEDGTMVVVEHAREYVGKEVQLTVTSALQTSAGRMIFGEVVR